MTARIAVVGAGLAGSLTALGLAAKGHAVDLVDRQPGPVGEASYFNEGKVHLGLLYANDPSRQTSRLMIEGAVVFRNIIAELTGFDVATALSTPFHYAIHHDSLLTPDEFESHMHDCCGEFAAAVGTTPAAQGYVDGSQKVTIERLAPSAWAHDLTPDAFAAVFLTDEYAVDPRQLAPRVVRALRAHDLVGLRAGTRVDRIEHQAGTGWILLAGDSSPLDLGRYDVVVNATWSDLLRLDAQVGLSPPHDWSYRYKLGNRIPIPDGPGALKSVTVALGAFGDIVNFGPVGGAFLSWYPTGRLLMTDAIDLPDWNGEAFADQRSAAYEASLRTWEGLSATLRELDVSAIPADTRGGMILAAGRVDVDDPSSPLHRRLEVGVRTTGTYVSVNTGKFTLAPLMATRAVDAVCEVLG